jgi:apoptosis-inducing factor 3
MGGGAAELSGPDFSSGVLASEVAEGGLLLGHANGEAVILTRRGNEVLAFGATCTHYSAPLADGLVTGDTLRCPWHHACFSIRTGEAVGAPALNPIPTFRVETSGDRVLVKEKIEKVAYPKSPGPFPSSVVIVGGGAAGHAAAEMLRRRGYDGTITMISADDAPPVDRPNLSKDFLAGNAPAEWIPLRPPEYFTEQRIDLRLGTSVVAIDTAGKTLTLSDGSSLPYGALLLATGGEPRKLDVPGADLPHVHVLRTLADTNGILAGLPDAKRAVVIGGSFIGLEVAASLRTRGLEVHVIAPEARPLERIMGPEVGDFVRALHEEKGVVFHLENGVTRIEKDRVELKKGDPLPADLVVVGVGVTPRTELAEKAGLTVQNGIVVDEQLRTGAPGVWAAGDVARYPDSRWGGAVRIEHWVVAMRQGQTAARNMLGEQVPFRDVPFFWSQHYDLPIAYVGHCPKWDEAELSGDLKGRDALVSLRAGGKTRAVITVYRDRQSLEAEVALEGEK